MIGHLLVGMALKFDRLSTSGELKIHLREKNSNSFLFLSSNFVVNFFIGMTWFSLLSEPVSYSDCPFLDMRKAGLRSEGNLLEVIELAGSNPAVWLQQWKNGEVRGEGRPRSQGTRVWERKAGWGRRGWICTRGAAGPSWEQERKVRGKGTQRPLQGINKRRKQAGFPLL